MDCSVTDSFCNDAKREYHYSWRKYSKSSFKTYLKAKDAYEFYYKHPDIAVKDQFGIDNNGEEVDSYTLGSIYSENVKHQLFQPVSDDASLRAIELARANGDTATFSALIFGLAIQLELMSPDDKGGGGIGRGSTGRGPITAAEQEAWNVVMADPLRGAKQLPIKLNDPMWSAEEGWIKMSRTVNRIEIHFNFNILTGEFDDFKIK